MQPTELVSGEDPANGHAHGTQVSEGAQPGAAGQWSTGEQLLMTAMNPRTQPHQIQAGTLFISQVPEPASFWGRWNVVIGPARPELGDWSTTRVTITPAVQHLEAKPSTGPGGCFSMAIGSIARMSRGSFSDPVQKLPSPHLTSRIMADGSGAFPPTEVNFANYNWSLPRSHTVGPLSPLGHTQWAHSLH